MKSEYILKDIQHIADNIVNEFKENIIPNIIGYHNGLRVESIIEKLTDTQYYSFPESEIDYWKNRIGYARAVLTRAGLITVKRDGIIYVPTENEDVDYHDKEMDKIISNAKTSKRVVRNFVENRIWRNILVEVKHA